MTANNMLRGRQVVASLTNQSGGAIIAGDVVIVSAANDESFTTTTSAAYNSTRVGVSLESIAAAAAGRVLLEGYAPLVNVSASATRGHYLFTHTVAKQATSSASYAAGAFGQIIKAGTTPSAMIFPVAQVGSAGVGGSSGSTDNAVIRADGTGGSTVQSSLATIDDSGSVNIPTGQTYNINNTPHTHAGGGGAATTDHFVTTVNESDLSAEIVIPGLAGSPDIAPGGVNDDEFDALSGWTTLGSLNTSNVTDFKSHWHAANTNIGYAVNGIYKSAPNMPFTVTAKLSDYFLGSNYVQAALMLTETSPGKLFLFGPLYGGFTAGVNDMNRGLWTSRTARASAGDTAFQTVTWPILPTFYLRLIVASSTDVTCQASNSGFIWQTFYSNTTSGLTVANVGLALAGNTSGGAVEAVFDWIRFT